MAEGRFVEIYHFDRSTHSQDSSGGLPAPSWPADYKLVASVFFDGPLYINVKEQALDLAVEELRDEENFNVSWEAEKPIRETGIGDVGVLWQGTAYRCVWYGWEPITEEDNSPEPDGGGGGGQVALTPMEISKQMQAADQIRALKAREILATERGEMQDRVGRGVVSACDDIYRRVFEEGWYGRTIHDVIYERQLPNADKGKDAVDDQQMESAKKEIEDILKTMYGTGKEQSDTPQRGQGQGMDV